MAKKKDADVSTPSLAYQAMVGRWTKMNTLLGGTEAMRAAGEEMAPRHEHESDRAYKDRIQSNVLFNMVDLTLRSWVGRPFGSPITYSEDFSPHLIPLMDDVDLAGNNIDVFARQWFRDGVAKAFSHVLVEFPRVPVGPRTLADDDRLNIRPYFVHVQPEQLIFAQASIVDGKEVLQHIRIREEVVQLDGWEEAIVEQIRVLELEWVNQGTDEEPDFVEKVRVSLYRKDEKDNWFVIDSWIMDIDFIPLVTFYADREGFMLGRSPLDDLADLNIRHWQSMSDQIAILTVARFPILACSGGDDEDKKLVVGPKEWLFTSDPTAKFYYVEHKGSAIAAGEVDIENLEKRMQSYGAEFAKERPDRESALARNLDTVEATSPLQDVTYRFNDALNYALWIMSQWMRKEHTGIAKVPTDFTSAQAAELQTLLETWKEGGLTTVEYLQELQRRGLLSEELKISSKSRNPDERNVNNEDSQKGE